MTRISYLDAVAHVAAHAVAYLNNFEDASGYTDLDHLPDDDASILNAAREAVIHQLRELGNLPVATA